MYMQCSRAVLVQMRWTRRNQFRVGRSFFGWAVENGSVYVAGGRVDAQSLRCSADVLCADAERIVRGCDDPCDALNTPADEDAVAPARPTPWRLVGRLPAATCVFAHCVVMLPVSTSADQGPPAVVAAAPSASSVSAAATSRCSGAQTPSQASGREKKMPGKAIWRL